MGADMDGVWKEHGTLDEFPSNGPEVLWRQPIGGGYAGRTVDFTVEVLSNTLTEAHTVKMFIKDFAGDFSSYEEASVMLDGPGIYNVSLTAIDDPTRVVQWGFQMFGVNVWATDVGAYADAEHVVFTHDQVFFTVNLYFRTRVFSEQNPVANLDFQSDAFAVVTDFAVSN